MSEMTYYDMNKELCEELCCEFKKFKEDKNVEILKGIKYLLESMVYLNELEAAGAMRRYLEDEHGYDSHTGEFREMMYPRYGIYNNALPPLAPYTNPMYGKNYDGMKRKMDGREYGRGYDYDDNGMDRRDMNRDSDMRGIYNMAHAKEHIKEMSDHDYDKWINNMVGAHTSSGGMWTEEETTAVAKKIGVNFDKFTPKMWQTTMDMLYSDFCEVAEKFGVDKPEFFAELSKAWLLDEDSLKGGKKLSAYHEFVVDE